MKRALFLLVLPALMIACGLTPLGTASAQERARFAIEGSNPGTDEISYRGTVTLTQEGDMLTVVWRIGKNTYVGTGILDLNTLAVGYLSGDQPGVALYTRDSSTGIFTGQWATHGGKGIGTERWLPRN